MKPSNKKLLTSVSNSKKSLNPNIWKDGKLIPEIQKKLIGDFKK